MSQNSSEVHTKRNSVGYAMLRSFMSVLSAFFAAGLGLIVMSVVASFYFEAPLMRGTLTPAPAHYSPMIISDSQGGYQKLPRSAPVLLRARIDGVIGLDELTAPYFRSLLIEADEGDLRGRVKGLLLYINSPGGTVEDADGIYRAVLEFKERLNIPVFAYVDGLCASGGLYIASAADAIFASDVSLVGSVGVIISSFFNVNQVLKKWGIESQTISAGKQKDLMNPFRPWKKDEDEPLKAIVDYYYDVFVNVVTKARPNLDKAKLVNEYGAGIFPAPIAAQYGFIDQAGVSLDQANQMLSEKMGLKEGDVYQVVEMERIYTFSDWLEEGALVLNQGIKHTLDLPSEMHPKLLNKALFLYRP